MISADFRGNVLRRGQRIVTPDPAGLHQSGTLLTAWKATADRTTPLYRSALSVKPTIKTGNQFPVIILTQ